MSLYEFYPMSVWLDLTVRFGVGCQSYLEGQQRDRREIGEQEQPMRPQGCQLLDFLLGNSAQSGRAAFCGFHSS